MKFKERIFRGMNYVILVGLLIVLLFASVKFVAFNEPYFRWHYQAHEIVKSTGIELDELMIVTKDMLNYLLDKRDNLDMTATINGKVEEVFGEREKAHMVDVKSMIVFGQSVRNFLFLLTVIYVVFLGLREPKVLEHFVKSVWKVFLIGIGVMTVVGLVLSTDFEMYFIKFHEIFFHNDLWMLDPDTDILINMVPEIFFFETVVGIVLSFLIATAATIGISRIALKKMK